MSTPLSEAVARAKGDANLRDESFDEGDVLLAAAGVYACWVAADGLAYWLGEGYGEAAYPPSVLYSLNLSTIPESETTTATISPTLIP